MGESANGCVRVSIACTVKNEAESIRALLSSLVNQTRSPDEVVVVDGGSVDSTMTILQDFSAHAPFSLKIVAAPGLGIAAGMNLAIRLCSHDVIACTHGGCKLDPRWLAEIVGPFEKNSEVDVVAGLFAPWAETEFEKLVGLLTCGSIDRVNPSTFLASSRSLAFRRHVWADVGGFPEWFRLAGEDTYFALAIRRRGFKVAFARQAVVYWRQRSRFKEVVKQFFRYARADGWMGYMESRLRLFSLYTLAGGLVAGSLFWPWLSCVLLFAGLCHMLRFSAQSRLFSFRLLALRYALDAVQICGYVCGALERLLGLVPRRVWFRYIGRKDGGHGGG